MTGERYQQLLGMLLSGDPEKVRSANRELYSQAVQQDKKTDDAGRDADLALARAFA